MIAFLHVFAPVEQHTTHLACVALDTLVGELAGVLLVWLGISVLGKKR